MTQLEWFRLLAPEYAAVSDVDVNGLLVAAALFVNVGCLDVDRANAATALYAAHLKYIQNLSATGEGARGPVKSEREGDLQRTYATADSSSADWLGQSIYGQQYANITLACVGGAIMTRFGSTPGVGEIAPYTDFLPYYGY